jgi:thioredoxin reductase (NADPH)
LLATGIVDESPDVPGLDEAVAKGSIRYCPVCDGYEAADQRIGVLGHGEDTSSKARFLRTYSNDITLLSLDESGGGNTEKARSLREAGIKVAGWLDRCLPSSTAGTACGRCCGMVKPCCSMSSIRR